MKVLLQVLLVVGAFGLTACGGGGDSGSSSSHSSSSSLSSSSSSSSSSSVASLSTSSESSVSLSSSSSQNSSSSSETSSGSSETSSSQAQVSVKISAKVNGFDLEGDSTALDSAKLSISLLLLDAEGQVLSEESPSATAYTGQDELRFSSQLSGAGATNLVLNLSYPGYTSYARKLDAAEELSVDAKLQELPQQQVAVTDKASVSGRQVQGFNISVSADSDSLQRDRLSIQIPASLLPEGTEQLDVALRSFDPNQPEDAEFFPGAYADSAGNKLASVAFNFADINTPAGEPLVQALQKARQQKQKAGAGMQKAEAEEPVIINREIPASSCALLESLGDSAPNIDGFQVPVYTYNPSSGLWDLLGQGSLYDDAGALVPAGQSSFDCANHRYTLEILVTSDIFLSQWWNLDYPLAFEQPQDYCALVQVKNPDDQLLAGVTGFVYDGDSEYNFASTYFTSDSQGQALIRVAQAASNADLQAQAMFFNAGDLGYVSHTIELGSDCTNPPLQVLELARPQLCEVSGNVRFTDNQPVARDLVYGYSTDTSETWGFDYGLTDEQGDFRLNLPCAGQYELFNFSANLQQQENTRHFAFDGTLGSDELSDDGKAVVMQNLQVDYTQPILFASYNPGTQLLTLTAFGYYDAFPLQAQVTIADATTQQQLASFSGQLDLQTENSDDEFAFYHVGVYSKTLALPSGASYYSMRVNFSDALGQSWSDEDAVVFITDEQASETSLEDDF